MNLLLGLWTWLDGKKTIISAICLTIALVMKQLLVDLNGYDPAWVEFVIKNLNYIGEAFGVTGLLHKATKTGTK